MFHALRCLTSVALQLRVPPVLFVLLTFSKFDSQKTKDHGKRRDTLSKHIGFPIIEYPAAYQRIQNPFILILMQGNGTAKSFHGTSDSAGRLQVWHDWHNEDRVNLVEMYQGHCDNRHVPFPVCFWLLLHEQTSEAFRIVPESISPRGASSPNNRSLRTAADAREFLSLPFALHRPVCCCLLICRCEPRRLITVSKMKLEELKGGRGCVWVGGALQCHYGCVQMSVRPALTGRHTHTHPVLYQAVWCNVIFQGYFWINWPTGAQAYNAVWEKCIITVNQDWSRIR